MGGGRLAEPLPAWLADAHEEYLIGQAVPSYSREYSDYELRVMAEIHQIHEHQKTLDLAKVLGKMFGAGDG